MQITFGQQGWEFLRGLVEYVSRNSFGLARIRVPTYPRSPDVAVLPFKSAKEMVSWFY